MIPNSTDAVRILLPLPPNKSCVSGTNTHNPKKPYTTDGIPASRSTPAFNGLYSRFGQNLARKTAVSIPMGTPMTNAPAVTYTLPRIIGRIPNLSLEAFHVVPPRNSNNPIFWIAGTPFTKRKRQISATARMDTQAVIKKTTFITFSFIRSPPFYLTSPQVVILPR